MYAYFSVNFSSLKKNNNKTSEVHHEDIINWLGNSDNLCFTGLILTDIPSQPQSGSKVDWVVVEAMKEWSAVTLLTFTEVSGEADIDISFDR